MVRSVSVRTVANLGIALALTLLLGACSSFSLPSLSSSTPSAAPEPGVAPEMPATIRSDEIVGRWGLASYQNPADRARTEAAARGQCKQPYVIGAGTSGGVRQERFPRHCDERLVRRSSTSEGGSDEAIHLSASRRHGLLRGACHRARVRATRWFAMTEN